MEMGASSKKAKHQENVFIQVTYRNLPWAPTQKKIYRIIKVGKDL